jgi:hypothetical protein
MATLTDLDSKAVAPRANGPVRSRNDMGGLIESLERRVEQRLPRQSTFQRKIIAVLILIGVTNRPRQYPRQSEGGKGATHSILLQ